MRKYIARSQSGPEVLKMEIMENISNHWKHLTKFLDILELTQCEKYYKIDLVKECPSVDAMDLAAL